MKMSESLLKRVSSFPQAVFLTYGPRTTIPESPGLVKMQILQSFSRPTEPESLQEAMDSRLATGPPEGLHVHYSRRTSAQGSLAPKTGASFLGESTFSCDG